MKHGRSSFALILLSMVFLGAAFSEESSNYSLMTENYPPFNYIDEEGTLTGFSTEVVRELCRRVGHPGDISLVPWSRGYNMVLSSSEQILFSMSRTDTRENLFRWVGPLASYEVVFFAKAGSGLSFESEEELKAVPSIGSGQNTSTPQELKKRGFKNLDLVADSSLNARKLVDGRITLWLSGRLSGIYRARQQGIDPAQMEVVSVFRRESLYIAFSRDTPDAVINRWQGALDAMKAEGRYEEILKAYRE